MENKIGQKVKEFYFLVIAVLMYYFITEVINLGLFITFRHAFALLIACSGIFCFLYTPNIAKGATAIKESFVYCAPLIVTVVVSLFIWFVGQVDTSIISRGLSAVFIYTNMISFTLAAATFLYVFGEKGIWYNLIAILVSNMLMIGTVIAQNGIGNYFNELFRLIITFAGETGDIIVQAEIHELAFCVGAYLIYMFLKPKKSIPYFILLLLSLFCFVSAFKRIGIIAIVIAVFIGWILMFVAKYKRDTARKITVFLSVLVVVILVGYVALIKMDVFAMLEQAGVETSGRVKIYDAVDEFYDFSPEFLGNGIGFLTYQLSNSSVVEVSAVHNDFLQYFIDLGFWGYIIWLFSMTVLRVSYFGRNGKIENSIITFALTIYLLIVSSTDNTMNYPLFTAVLAIIMMGHGFDENVRETEKKIFGCVTNNK